ncbi:DUF3120 domain-containing protein [cf. Phormidesmis sp. LEGE 11477]|nr:DUF3120 domain-containing protein [cf. Phormidesmis sp. LEGE 11477]
MSNKSRADRSLRKAVSEGDDSPLVSLCRPLSSVSCSDRVPTPSDSGNRLRHQVALLFSRTRVQAFAASAFLVAVPVFIQAPLVRLVPQVCLLTTAIWLLLGWKLLQKASTQLWGDLIIGFSWTWLAGAVYWGWFRWDPYVHLPIEALGLPIVLILLRYGKAKIGNYFYLGSLLGTAITDLYFYCVGLIPYWRALMVNPPEQAGVILHNALMRMETYQGVGSAIVLLSLLIMLGTIPLRSHSTRWWAFSGAVLSTILVDSLFFVAAIFA